ncbi:hypothetical protein [Thiolapillus sp.]|uniref:hypothetical protein n=1 Tax=Thiolapillus sp. TaxID=2017437 RepID=UPI003AF9E79B
MKEILEKYGLDRLKLLTPSTTQYYVLHWQRGLYNAVTSSASDDDLAQLAHAIRQRAYARGFGLMDVYEILCTRRDRLLIDAAKDVRVTLRDDARDD